MLLSEIEIEMNTTYQLLLRCPRTDFSAEVTFVQWLIYFENNSFKLNCAWLYQYFLKLEPCCSQARRKCTEKPTLKGCGKFGLCDLLTKTQKGARTKERIVISLDQSHLN